MIRDLTYEDYAEKLHEDYKTAYKDIKAYLEIMHFSDEDITDTMVDVVELLLAAQTEGTPVKSVVGEDMAAFCRQLGQALEPSRKQIVWSWLMSFAIAGAIVSIGMMVYAAVLLITREGGLTKPISAGIWFAYWLLLGGMDGLYDKLSWFWWSHKKRREAGLASLRGSVNTWGWCLINIVLILTRGTERSDFLSLPLWMPLLIVTVFCVSVFFLNWRKKRRMVKEKYPSFGKVDEEKLGWNEQIRELREEVATKNRERHPHQEDMTREERQIFVRRKLRGDVIKYPLLSIIPLGIYGFILWVTIMMLHDGEMTLTDFWVGLLFWTPILLGWAGLNIWIAVKQHQFNKKYLATGKDILDDTLLYDLY
ncbi:MAG: DUF1048 domain-containing protein [Clostridiales bacterium]|nr:DUF1048 domain-containing protein [Candidatus Cacconaster stercorequi]